MAEPETPPSPGPPPPHRPGDVVLWGLLLYGACRAAELLLEAQAMAASVAQAVLAEWGAARLGIFWTAPGQEVTTSRIARRAGFGAAIGVVAAGLVALSVAAGHGAIFEAAPRIEASVLILGFVSAGIFAWRDELLLRGLVLRALEDQPISVITRVLACGATSVGAALGRSDANPRTAVVAALLGILFGTLWIRDRGAWRAWAANTMLHFTTGTLLAGGILQSRVADNAWGGAVPGLLGGTAAVVALAPLATYSLITVFRTVSTKSAGVG
jgi:hypothetical protein